MRAWHCLLAASLLAACSAACDSSPPPSGSQPAPPTALHAKPGAPVQIEAELRERAARLTLRFGAAATGVSVALWGVDGLEVTSAANPIAGTAVAAGEVLRLEVDFAAPRGGHLAVAVDCEVGGQRLRRVQSFTVGTPGLATKARAPIVESEGRRLKVQEIPATP